MTPSISLLAATALSIIGTLGVTAMAGAPGANESADKAIAGWIRPPHPALLGSVGGLGMVLGGVTVTVVAYTAELGSPAWAGVIFGLNAGASLLAAVVVGRMGLRDLASGHRKATLWLLAVLIPYALGEGLAYFTIAAMIAGLGTSPNLIHANSLVTANTSPERRTEAYSWIAAAAGIGIAVGSVISGLAVDSFGADAARIWITVFAACPAAITFATSLTKRRGA